MSATTPYTPTVMASATMIRMMVRDSKPSLATSFKAMTMISADRMKSVRMAPAVICFSRSSPWANDGSAACSGSCPLTFSHSFSAPSKHR